LGTPEQASSGVSQYLSEHWTQAGDEGLRQAQVQLVAVHATSPPKQLAQARVSPTDFWMHAALQSAPPRQPVAHDCIAAVNVPLCDLNAARSSALLHAPCWRARPTSVSAVSKVDAREESGAYGERGVDGTKGDAGSRQLQAENEGSKGEQELHLLLCGEVDRCC
jgi:hypothetical protein